MTEKATIEGSVETEQILSNNDAPSASQPDYKVLPWENLQTSPTNPRRRINEQTIESLAESIRIQGVLEPLIVRPKGEKYEIVCGERRFRAAKVANVTEMPCLVRELSDEQVLDIQIHENLHREDIHVMDEAYAYQFLKEKLNCDVKELALRVGKPEGYVLNRLKLNLLIEEAQKDLESEDLPLSYALELAKYTSDIQKVIYAEIYRKEGKYEDNRWIETPNKGEMVPWKHFLEWNNTHIHRLLSRAPFNPKATNLRTDGLPCVKCPERTGAVVGLFEPNQVGKRDACLNPACYLQKVENQMQNRRRELAELHQVEVSEVPLVRSWCYTNGDDYLGIESALVISGAKRGGNAKNCDRSVSGIDIETENYGEVIEVCLKTSGCEVHWSKAANSSTGTSNDEVSAQDQDEERLEAHRGRREEIWNAKVAEVSRVRVLKQAAEKFEKKFKITEVGTDFLPQLIARFWSMTSSGDSNNLQNVVKFIVNEWQVELGHPQGVYIGDARTAIDFFKKLDRGSLFRILFLLIHGHKGTIGHDNTYRSQKDVKELAVEFGADYSLIDAEVRLELSAKKHLESHQSYLNAVRESEINTNIPRLFSENWKAKE